MKTDDIELLSVFLFNKTMRKACQRLMHTDEEKKFLRTKRNTGAEKLHKKIGNALYDRPVSFPQTYKISTI